MGRPANGDAQQRLVQFPGRCQPQARALVATDREAYLLELFRRLPICTAVPFLLNEPHQPYEALNHLPELAKLPSSRNVRLLVQGRCRKYYDGRKP